jgi:hypothetical protein
MTVERVNCACYFRGSAVRAVEHNLGQSSVAQCAITSSRQWC